MAITRTNLGICGVDDCADCWVDMKVCDRCGRGPLNDSDPDVCGEPDCMERESDSILAARMALADLMRDYRPGSEDPPWSWDDEERSLHEMPCPYVFAIQEGRIDETCVDPCDDPEPGCYQRKLEAYIAEVGSIEQPVCLGYDGRVWDGHHRIVAARRLGIAEIPIEGEA